MDPSIGLLVFHVGSDPIERMKGQNPTRTCYMHTACHVLRELISRARARLDRRTYVPFALSTDRAKGGGRAIDRSIEAYVRVGGEGVSGDVTCHS
jgi:hypothetical protein